MFGVNTTNFFLVDADQTTEAVNEAIKNKIQELALVKNSFSQDDAEDNPLTQEIAEGLYSE